MRERERGYCSFVGGEREMERNVHLEEKKEYKFLLEKTTVSYLHN